MKLARRNVLAGLSTGFVTTVALCTWLLTPTACTPAQAAKSAGDIATEVGCVAQHWGQPVSAVAVACFGGEESLAIDAIAAWEALMQKRGAPPTPAYRADARVAQKVLTALASDAGQ